MTQSRFFQLSLSFPLILWGIGLVGFSIFTKQNFQFIMKHLFDAVRVFVPYIIFAAALWRLSDNRPYRILILLSVFMPIVWGVFFMLCYLVNAIFTDQVRDLHILLIMAFWATVVAYMAEIIPLMILSVFKNDFRSAVLQQEDQSPIARTAASTEV